MSAKRDPDPGRFLVPLPSKGIGRTTACRNDRRLTETACTDSTQGGAPAAPVRSLHPFGSVLNPSEALQAGDALLIVDVQPDFCPGGKLAIEEGNRVIPVLNDWIRAARARSVPIYASRDWHPPGHVSFLEEGGEWPPHCVQDTPGARYHPDLDLPADAVKIAKGVRLDRDQYSAFDGTGLAEHLRKRRVARVWIGGLAEDVCVRRSAVDGSESGFEMHLIPGGTRAITPEGRRAARDEMLRAGVVLESPGS